MRIFYLFISILLSLSLTSITNAEPLNGPTLLTVTGKISNPNRSPIDDFHDAFFVSQDVDFEKARQFDLESLKALGFQKFKATYEDWPSTLEFEGPLLKDVLATAGAKGTTIIAKALDGYAPEIPMSDLEKYPVMLALKVNGKFLGVGDRGPAWIVYPRDNFDDLKEQDDSKYVWSTYLIEVK